MNNSMANYMAKATVLFSDDMRSGRMTAHVVAARRAVDGWVARRVKEDMVEFGLERARISIRADQEPSQVRLHRAVVQHREGARATLVHAIKRLRGLAKVAKPDLEARWGGITTGYTEIGSIRRTAGQIGDAERTAASHSLARR